jgi:hypothetical protein
VDVTRIRVYCTHAYTRARRHGRHACEGASVVVRRGDVCDQRPVLELHHSSLVTRAYACVRGLSECVCTHYARARDVEVSARARARVPQHPGAPAAVPRLADAPAPESEPAPGPEPARAQTRVTAGACVRACVRMRGCRYVAVSARAWAREGTSASRRSRSRAAASSFSWAWAFA